MLWPSPSYLTSINEPSRPPLNMLSSPPCVLPKKSFHRRLSSAHSKRKPSAERLSLGTVKERQSSRWELVREDNDDGGGWRVYVPVHGARDSHMSRKGLMPRYAK